MRGWEWLDREPPLETRGGAPAGVRVRASSGRRIVWMAGIDRKAAASRRTPNGVWMELRRGALVDDHPGSAELVAEHAETMGEESFLQGHENLAAIGEQVVDAFGFGDAVEGEREIDAAHRLETIGGNIVGHEIGFTEGHAGVHDF